MKTNTRELSSKKFQFKFFLIFLLLAGLCAVLWAIGHYGGATIPPRLLLLCRWLAVIVFCAYAFARRSLTVWLAAVQKQTASDLIQHIFPENIAKSVAEGQVLQVVVFSIIFGIALALVSEARRRPLLEFSESLSETMFKFTNIVMLFAPVGVAGAIAYTVGTMGFGVLVNLLKLVAT